MYLYLKTHNVTGMKYLGKTSQDPFKYRGSGVRWLNHIKLHGNDVRTEILLETDSFNELRDEGLRLSREWDIVESQEFANLVEESGAGGKTRTSWTSDTSPRPTKALREKFSRTMSELNSTQVKCPHCDKVANYPIMKRWHFDNCKHK